MLVALVTLAVIIILPLAGYAGFLLAKLKRQNERQQQAETLLAQGRNQAIFESVETICLATEQGQCDLSEAAIRLYCILDHVQGEQRIHDYDSRYPGLFALYQVVKDMQRGEARQQLDKKERMQQNLTRHKAEAQYQQQIDQELPLLRQHVSPLAHPTSTCSSTEHSPTTDTQE